MTRLRGGSDENPTAATDRLIELAIAVEAAAAALRYEVETFTGMRENTDEAPTQPEGRS